MSNWTTEPQPFGPNHAPLLEGLSSDDGKTPVPVAVDPATGRILVSSSGATVYSKPTDLYGIQAISNDGTYKYFFFEDADTNYYVLRKLIATSVFSYVAGNGSYTTVYQSSVLGPSGSPNWQSYGLTF